MIDAATTAAWATDKGLVIGDALPSHADERRAEVEVAVHVRSRMLDLGRPNSVRIA